VLQSVVVATDRPHLFAFVADGLGVHAERTFTFRPTSNGLHTIVVSHETQVGWLAWLGRLYLAPRLHRVNQVMFEDLARALEHDARTFIAARPPSPERASAR
jgi:hypothetical protein